MAGARGGGSVNEQRWLRIDALLYGASAVFALVGALAWKNPLQREWARLALVPYAAGAVVCLAMARGGLSFGVRAAARRRVAVCLGVLVFAAVGPLLVEVTLRALGGPLAHAQSETMITEQAAQALLDGHNPYDVVLDDGPLATWPPEVTHHLPYLPGMLVFGLPRAVGGDLPVFDARLAWTGTALLVAAWSLRRSRAGLGPRLLALQVLFVLPLGAVAMAGGGDDLAVLALMLAALALAADRLPVAAGAVAGLAVAMKLTAWPLLPFLALAARDRRGRGAGVSILAAAAGVMVPIVLPFVLWNADALIGDVFGYPLTGALEGPGVGVLGDLLGLTAAKVTLGLVALGAVAASVLRPPADIAAAARRAALLSLLSVLLVPGARFGLLAYPLNLAVWSRLFRDRSVPLQVPAPAPIGQGSRHR